MSVAIVRKLAWHFGLLFVAAAEELWDDVEMTPTLVLVWLHLKSLLFPDIYYDWSGLTSPLCMTQERGTTWETHKNSSEPFSKVPSPSGKDPSLKAKLPLAYLDLPATSP